MMQALRFAAVLGAAALLLPSGCGPAEPKYYHVSGSVTYDGKNVPKGKIYFEPQGKGQGGQADIFDSKYDTKAPGGKGVLGGPYSIRIQAFDGKIVYESPLGNGLCPEYTTSRDLPKQDQTLDIDVPKAKKN